MRQSASLPLDRLLLFLVLSLADLLITILLLTSSPYAAEVNPIARAWFVRYEWQGLVVFKALVVVIVSAIGMYISLCRPETGRKVLTFACLVLGLVVIYSYRLLIHVI
jgi:uncharacterized membrane protein